MNLYYDKNKSRLKDFPNEDIQRLCEDIEKMKDLIFKLQNPPNDILDEAPKALNNCVFPQDMIIGPRMMLRMKYIYILTEITKEHFK